MLGLTFLKMQFTKLFEVHVTCWGASNLSYQLACGYTNMFALRNDAKQVGVKLCQKIT